jgi:hypothetical protein
VPLKAYRKIEDYVHQFVQIIQQAAWDSMPNPRKSPNMDDCAPLTKQKILEKRQKTMATHQVSARQSKTKQSSARTKAAPQRPKTKGDPNLPGKLVSHQSHRLLDVESNKKN